MVFLSDKPFHILKTPTEFFQSTYPSSTTVLTEAAAGENDHENQTEERRRGGGHRSLRRIQVLVGELLQLFLQVCGLMSAGGEQTQVRPTSSKMKMHF